MYCSVFRGKPSPLAGSLDVQEDNSQKTFVQPPCARQMPSRDLHLYVKQPKPDYYSMLHLHFHVDPECEAPKIGATEHCSYIPEGLRRSTEVPVTIIEGGNWQEYKPHANRPYKQEMDRFEKMQPRLERPYTAPIMRNTYAQDGWISEERGRVGGHWSNITEVLCQSGKSILYIDGREGKNKLRNCQRFDRRKKYS